MALNWKLPQYLACALSLLVMDGNARAEEIYKIVDDAGRVSYSNEPPTGNEEVEVIPALPPPAEADVEDARQRQVTIEEEFSKQDRERAEQARLRQSAATNTTVTIVQSPTVIVGGRGYGHGYGRGRFYPGAPLAPGAPTAPGYRPRPPHAVPLPAGPTRRQGP